MSPLHPAALLVSFSLMTGCTVGPDYQRPDAALAHRYLGQASVEQRSAATSASLVAWWEGFADPVLSNLIAQALEQNLDLAQASARVTQARAGLGLQMPRYCPLETSAGRPRAHTNPWKHPLAKC